MKKGGGGFMERSPVAILLGTITRSAPKKVSYRVALYQLSCVPVSLSCKNALEICIDHCRKLAGWTPQSFTSSRKSRAEVKKQSIFNFLDDDEKTVNLYSFYSSLVSANSVFLY